MMSVLALNNVGYTYEGARKAVFGGLSVTFEMGKIYALVGKSGAGKSTLLSLIAGLDTCTDGDVLYKGKSLKSINRDDYRARDVGVIFQGYNLLLNATAAENIELSMNISGSPGGRESIYSLLESMGVDRDTADRQVLKLSGGEQQRVGIARALSHEPDILIADEPTGNLDQETQADIMKIFERLAHEKGKCVIIVTHSKRVSGYADETWGMANGALKKLER